LIACSLAGAGARVTVVEAGPQVDRGVALNRLERAAIRVPEAPYEMAPYAESPATIKDTYIQQDGPDPFRSTYLRLVGGTTWHWLGTALRLLPSDLELRSRYSVGEDWPLRYSDLAPWLTRRNPSSACPVPTMTFSDRHARSHIQCRACLPHSAIG
jgi:choline dehydrogenase-like flavoprotein